MQSFKATHLTSLSTLCILATGCISYTPNQVAKMGDDELCHHFSKNDLAKYDYKPETRFLIENEVGLRNIDCHPHHRQCLSHGHKRGSKGYADCRMNLTQIAAESQQINQFMDGLKAVKGTHSSHSTTINSNSDIRIRNYGF